MGLVFAAYLPNKPETTSILSPIEREIVVARLKHEQGAQDNSKDTGALYGFVLAVTDPKLWFIAAMLYCVRPFLPLFFSYFPHHAYFADIHPQLGRQLLPLPRRLTRLLVRLLPPYSAFSLTVFSFQSNDHLLPHRPTLDPRRHHYHPLRQPQRQEA